MTPCCVQRRDQGLRHWIGVANQCCLSKIVLVGQMELTSTFQDILDLEG